MRAVICFRYTGRQMFSFLVAVVFCFVISVCHGQDDDNEEASVAAQLFELQRVVPKSEQNEVTAQQVKMAKQIFEISPENPFFPSESAGKLEKVVEMDNGGHANTMVYDINPENPFLQQFLANFQEGTPVGGHWEVTTGRPRRTSTQRVTTTTGRRAVSRITSTTPPSTTQKAIPGLTLYLSPTIQETRKKHQHTLHTSRPALRPITSTTSSLIIGSFLPKTNANVVSVFQRIGEPGVEPAPTGETAGEGPLLSEAEVEQIFTNYEVMRLEPKLFVSEVK